ncbi:MAG: L-aspartate oxidase [Gammaproteobacteria bacterium]|jgi:L-aspartate oxidase
MNGRELSDILVVGAGVAGASVALRLADAGRHVTVLARTPLLDSASNQAMGGIAAAIAPDDSPALHLADTLAAGGELCRESTVRGVVERAPAAIEWLLSQGVQFDRDGEELDLTQEGAHSRRRVVHAADTTGRAVMEALLRRLRAHPRITLLERHAAVDLLVETNPAVPGGRRCCGAQVLDLERGLLRALHADHVVLATGGASGIYAISTNRSRPVGDGIALSWRAGCRVADMEMVQFHPTALRHPDAEGWLVTEAVRGEGGRLLLPDGERFMHRYDARAELAPRDIVARAIHSEMAAHKLEFVLLDISHAGADFVRRHFPNTYEHCLAVGIDITREPIPVAPAAHYTCGGVVTGGAGQTDLAGLYAIGETAWTGLHGANRLASNSLLEGLVYGEAAAAAILADVPRGFALDTAAAPRALRAVLRPLPARAAAEARQLAQGLRRIMSREVGIVRSDHGLAAAAARLEALQARARALLGRFGPVPELLELRNLACVGLLVARSARLRCESRGAHFNRDHPEPGPHAMSTVLGPETTGLLLDPRAVA